MAIRVFDLVLDKMEQIHQPQEVYRLGGWGGGLDVNPPKIGRATMPPSLTTLSFAGPVGIAWPMPW